MPKVDPRRIRSVMMNFRTTPAVARFIKTEATALSEDVSTFCREAIKMRIEIHRTYKEVAEQMGFRDPETLVWHAVQEYAKRHAPIVVTMPKMPEQTEMEIPNA